MTGLFYKVVAASSTQTALSEVEGNRGLFFLSRSSKSFGVDGLELGDNEGVLMFTASGFLPNTKKVFMSPLALHVHRSSVFKVEFGVYHLKEPLSV